VTGEVAATGPKVGRSGPQRERPQRQARCFTTTSDPA
jgi:hypothetical protein